MTLLVLTETSTAPLAQVSEQRSAQVSCRIWYTSSLRRRTFAVTVTITLRMTNITELSSVSGAPLFSLKLCRQCHISHVHTPGGIDAFCSICIGFDQSIVSRALLLSSRVESIGDFIRRCPMLPLKAAVSSSTCASGAANITLSLVVGLRCSTCVAIEPCPALDARRDTYALRSRATTAGKAVCL